MDVWGTQPPFSDAVVNMQKNFLVIKQNVSFRVMAIISNNITFNALKKKKKKN